jgi:hypothetical protein
MPLITTQGKLTHIPEPSILNAMTFSLAAISLAAILSHSSPHFMTVSLDAIFPKCIQGFCISAGSFAFTNRLRGTASSSS